MLAIAIQPLTDADRLRKNPLGIYVNTINWSKELGQ
ncbi:VirB8/TrbF family protein [Bradyrhizobium japonicum]